MSLTSGKEIRLRRIFREDGKTVISALDMGMFSGTVPGLQDIRSITKTVVEAGADAIIVSPGWAQATADIYGGKCGLILRITGGVSRFSADGCRHTLTTTVEHAVALGADAVMNMVFIGDPNSEHEQLCAMRELSWECHKYGMPLFTELLHVNYEDQSDPQWIDACMRAGFEYGADAIKILYARENFDKIIQTCPVPVVMAGSPKSGNLLDMVKDTVDAGGRGCAIGRNVYGSQDPGAMIRSLRKVVHG